jgi:hypothetical protein
VDPKAGRHDELGQAIIPPLIETQRECILVENSSSQKGGKKKTLKARPGQEAKHRKHCRLSRPALSRATCNGIARGEARRAATGVPEKSSSRQGTLHQITAVTTSHAQSVVTSCILGLCALLEYWTPTHSSRHLLLVQCRSRNNGVSAARCRAKSKPSVKRHTYKCEHACVSTLLLSAHIYLQVHVCM